MSSAVKQLRNRVVERKRMLAAELMPNGRNWRKHPKAQKDALQGVLEEVGQVGELYAYHSERAGGKLVLVDGHLRADLDPGQEWDVAITDLDDAEADKVLLTHDPLAAMAEANRDALDSLMRDVQTTSEALAGMVTDLAKDAGIAALTQDATQETGEEEELREQFNVLVECKEESEQVALLERLTVEGYQCRSLIS